MADIAKNIKTFRQAKNLTQRQLSEKLNVSENTIQNWEYGKTKPTVDILIDLCKALSVTPNQFLDYDEPEIDCIIQNKLIEEEKKLRKKIYNELFKIAENIKNE